MYVLSLELIGDDAIQVIREFGRLFGEREPLSGLFPWVAKLRGTSKRFGFDREFLSGQKDYSQSNSVGSRGVVCHYHLQEGEFYDVFERVTWGKSRRYYCTIENNTLYELTREEVVTWLVVKQELESTC